MKKLKKKSINFFQNMKKFKAKEIKNKKFWENKKRKKQFFQKNN